MHDLDIQIIIHILDIEEWLLFYLILCILKGVRCDGVGIFKFVNNDPNDFIIVLLKTIALSSLNIFNSLRWFDIA